MMDWSCERTGTVSKKLTEQLRRILTFNGVQEEDEKARQLEAYIELMEKNRDWAKLTSRGISRDYAAVLADSLAVVVVGGCDQVMRVADIGAGGGLLGMVCAIACPRWQVTLIESSSRKAAFLVEAAGSLDLGNVVVANERAESLATGEAYDIVVSRAAGRLADLAPIALGLLVKGGRYIVLKASDAEEETDRAAGSLAAASGRLVETIQAQYPPALAVKNRASLVVIEKL